MNTRNIAPLQHVDFTPETGNYRSLQSFRNWCQKVLPLVYDDSLSYYELLCKVVKYLNDVIENVDLLQKDMNELLNAYNQLQEYVNNYFNNLNVQVEINNKLDEMANNGSLDILIRGTDFLENIYTYPIGFYSNGLQPQGSQYYDGILYTCWFNSSNEDESRIISIDLNNGSIKNDIVGNFGHCNSCCVYNNKLYIARGGLNATNQNYIDIIDLTTFTRLDSIALEYDIISIAFDYSTNNFYCFTSVSSHLCYIYDVSFNLLNSIIIDHFGANAWQSATVDENYIYMCSYRSNNGVDGIAVYFKNGKLKSFIKSMTNIEIEDISIYGNNFLITSYTGGGMLIQSAKIYANTSNLGRIYQLNEYRLQTNDVSLSIYMNKEYKGILQNGSSERPFNNYTALVQSCFYNFYTTMTINIYGDFSDVNITLPVLTKIRSLTFNGYNNAKLGSIFIGCGCNVNVNNIEFTGTASDGRAAISFRNTTLTVSDCTFTSDSNIGIYNESGILSISGCTFTNNVPIRGIREATFNIGLSNKINKDISKNVNCVYNVPLKRIVGFGDSIMAGTHTTNTLLSLFFDRTNLIYTNKGLSGGRYYGTELGLLKQLKSVSSEDFEVGLIVCGTNDYGNNVSESNFRNYVTSCFDYINSNFGDKPILVCTPFHRTPETANTAGLTLKNYVDILLEIGAEKGIMMYDCYSDQAMNFSNNSNLTTDGLHPNDYALERIYPSLLNKLV